MAETNRAPCLRSISEPTDVFSILDKVKDYFGFRSDTDAIRFCVKFTYRNMEDKI